jgi:hypothetical protein
MHIESLRIAINCYSTGTCRLIVIVVHQAVVIATIIY